MANEEYTMMTDEEVKADLEKQNSDGPADDEDEEDTNGNS